MADSFEMREKMTVEISQLKQENKRLRNIEVIQTKYKKAIKFLVESTAGVTGQEYFDRVVDRLSNWLDCEVSLVGEIVNNSEVKAFTMIVDGQVTNEFAYELTDTPCNEVSKKGYCFYPENITALFPQDDDLKKLGAVGYVGTPLIDKNGNVIGILNAVSRKKLKLPEYAEDILNIIAERTTAEISRIRAEGEIKTLRGILPLCSHCKKIRDDKGHWQRVDVYIDKHSQADISHSICPECAKEHFPDLDIYDD